MGTLVVQSILTFMAAGSVAFGLYWPWALWMLRRRGETVVITGSSEDWTGGRHGYLLFYADHHGDHHLIRTSDLFRRAGKAERKGKVSPLPDAAKSASSTTGGDPKERGCIHWTGRKQAWWCTG
ncbi:hypothetical protein ABZT43_01825 [Streptomyces sp. NPDC005349]|uniref:hypothetical protein n=1 Tax=Streptomyces sp. NPDC005349 TaxID=3157037 RepID=UPI00339FBB07